MSETVADLTIGDIGRMVRVSHSSGIVYGRLVRIEAAAEVFDESFRLGDAEATSPDDVVIGQVSVILTLGRAVVPVRRDAMVEVMR